MSNQKIKKEYIINYLNYNFKIKEELPLLDFIFTVDSYELLGIEIPAKNEVIRYFNGIQTDEGTWRAGEIHYVPDTAQVLWIYSRWGIKPAKSLKPFFQKINTWKKVVTHVQRYDPGNFWGGLWGYVACYVMRGKKPPWTKKFLKDANKKFDSWVLSNHQRMHLVGSLLQLQEPIPRIEEIVKIALQQQKKDGSWGDPGWNKELPQTFFALSLLKVAKERTNIFVDDAIEKGLKFIHQCYTVVTHEEKKYAGFTTSPNEIFPKLLETAMGIASLFNLDFYLK